MRRAAVYWESDPIRDVVEAYRALYPTKPVRIRIGPVDGDALGYTEFFEVVPRVPVVTVDVGLTIPGVMDILAHELAHVAAGSAVDHGPEWQAAYDAIHDEYDRRIQEAGPTTQYTPDGVPVTPDEPSPAATPEEQR